MQNKFGPSPPHNEACRGRIEKFIGDDESDDRTTKAKERLEHDLAWHIEEKIMLRIGVSPSR